MKTAESKKPKAQEKSIKSLIYQAKNGAIELKADVVQDTIWATQMQIAKLFDIDRTVATKHINNLIKDDEISKKSNVQKMHIANSDKPVLFYSLDVILSVGYRANSQAAINFRKWANKTLKTYISQGFVINQKQVSRNYKKFDQAINDIKLLLSKNKEIDIENILDLVNSFANTWLSLDAYDKAKLSLKGVTKKQIILEAKELKNAIFSLKTQLIKKKEATEIFAKERYEDTVEGIIGNVMQSFGGGDLYKTVEEKAAHLFYFMVKNHPFIDGNKRSGAFSFIWFLQKYNLLDVKKISPQALTALTILIAESNPKEKEKMIGLVLMLLKN